MKHRLLIAIGNTGRGDDGLGWAFGNQLKSQGGLDVVYRYQLQIEDAELISHYEQVWFVDASHEFVKEGFEYLKIEGEGRFSYTTHSLHPEAIVQLCRELYHRLPEATLIAISGEDFDLGKTLSLCAQNNLYKALDSFGERFMFESALTDDEYADASRNPVSTEPESVESRRNLREIKKEASK